MLGSTLADLRRRRAAFDAWTGRRWPALSAAGYALAFAIVFGGATLAAYHTAFDLIGASVCGVLFILFIRLYARSIPADRRHPEPGDPAKPDEIPGWAVVVYIFAGLAVTSAIAALEGTFTSVSVALFVAWAVGQTLLNLFWRKRDGTTAFGTAFIAFDERLDAFAARHARPLHVIGTILAFVLLFGSIALHAYETGFVRTAAAICGNPCKGDPDIAVAAYCGAFALLYAFLYAKLTGGIQRLLLDPWKHVRPEPAPARVSRWAVVIHVLIGFVVFFVIAAYGDTPVQADDAIIRGGPKGGTQVTLGGHALLAWIVGWCIGGRGVLQYHWPKPFVPNPHTRP